MMVNYKIIGCRWTDTVSIIAYASSSLYASALAPWTMAGKPASFIVGSSAASWLLLALLPGNRSAMTKLLTCQSVDDIQKATLVNMAVAFFACAGVAFTLSDNQACTTGAYGMQSGALLMKQWTQSRPLMMVALLSGGGLMATQHWFQSSDSSDTFNQIIIACQMVNVVNVASELYQLFNNNVPSHQKHALTALFLGIATFSAFAITTHSNGVDEAVNNALLTTASFLVLGAVVRLELLPMFPSHPETRIPLLPK
ncbi:MAG: hypothetical protein ACON35_06575 [Candidatus Marinamargulisbacteria bacterium]